MKLQTFVFAVLTTCAMLPAKAQQDSIKKCLRIEQLIKILKLDDFITAGADTSAEQTIRNTPLLLGHETEARAFFKKHIGWPGFKDDLVKIYAKYYNAEEIDELIEFYQTSAGRKMLLNNQQLQQEIVIKQTEKLQKNVAELNKLVNPAVTPGSANH